MLVECFAKLETFALFQGQEGGRGLSDAGTDFARYSDISGRLRFLHDEAEMYGVAWWSFSHKQMTV